MRTWASWIIIKNKKILLLKRGNYTKAFPWFWTFPWGRQENLESAEEIVVREVYEESWLLFTPEKLYQKSIVKNWNEDILSYRFIGSFIWDIVVQYEEADGYAWYTYEETKNLNIAFDYKEVLDMLRDDNIL